MTKLGFYKYAPAILESWDKFHIEGFKEKIENGMPLLFFKWNFGIYSGYGEIYYSSDTKKVRNTFGDNFSVMHITEPSMQELWDKGLKHYSPLYNEPGLEDVFNKILDYYFLELVK